MELIDRKALTNEDPCEHCHYKKAGCVYTCGDNGHGEHAIWRTIDDAPTIDAETVLKGVHDQIRWERDMAMAQLEEIGVGFCEKTDDVVRVVRCKECKHSLENNGLLVIGSRFCHRNIDGNDVYETVWDCDFCSRAEGKELSLEKTSDKTSDNEAEQ